MALSPSKGQRFQIPRYGLDYPTVCSHVITDAISRLIISEDVSRETYGKEQIQMQEDAKTERREMVLLLESHWPADFSSMS
jgi:hypothetical protein